MGPECGVSVLLQPMSSSKFPTLGFCGILARWMGYTSYGSLRSGKLKKLLLREVLFKHRPICASHISQSLTVQVWLHESALDKDSRDRSCNPYKVAGFWLGLPTLQGTRLPCCHTRKEAKATPQRIGRISAVKTAQLGHAVGATSLLQCTKCTSKIISNHCA